MWTVIRLTGHLTDVQGRASSWRQSSLDAAPLAIPYLKLIDLDECRSYIVVNRTLLGGPEQAKTYTTEYNRTRITLAGARRGHTDVTVFRRHESPILNVLLNAVLHILKLFVVVAVSSPVNNFSLKRELITVSVHPTIGVTQRSLRASKPITKVRL